MNLSVNNGDQSHVPPGFRFHPTEEELLHYYLRKKVTSQKIDLDVIPDVELNKLEPWDIQEKCRVGSGPQTDWYFFSHKDKKYPTGSRTNRATVAGFWKATGRDKVIYSNCKRIGMRKTLVFYKGRAPHGQKSDWIMHEYRLDEISPSCVGSSLAGELSGTQEECWVVCRIFKKKSYHKAVDRVPNNSGDLVHSHPGNDGVLDQILTYMGRVSSKQQINGNGPTNKNNEATDNLLLRGNDEEDSVVEFMHLPGLETEPGMETISSNNHLHHHLPSSNRSSTFYNQPFGEDHHIWSQTKPSLGSTNWVAMDRLVASQLNGHDDNLYFPITDHSRYIPSDDGCHISHPNSNEVEFWSYPNSSPSDPLSHLSV